MLCFVGLVAAVKKNSIDLAGQFCNVLSYQSRKDHPHGVVFFVAAMVFYRFERGGNLVHRMLGVDKELAEPFESARDGPGTCDRELLIFGIGTAGIAALLQLAK